jgi:hypothetical protein
MKGYIIKSLEKSLKKYDLIEKNEENANIIRDYFFENYKKPLIKWIISIFLTTIPIFLSLICYFTPSLEILRWSVGIAIAWWILSEFVM